MRSTSITRVRGRPNPLAGILDRSRIIASPGYNRWLVPPAALAIHLCIGMAYGFSVFWLPLSRAIGGGKPVACPTGSGILNALFTTSCDWLVADLNWVFTLFIVVLGIAAALWGGWLERAGPRKAGVIAAICWSGGLVLGAVGIITHQLWILWLGTGVIGGIGLGLGLHFPRIDIDQMVSGPARHGHRHGDHGLRRWGDDRCPAGADADGAFRNPGIAGGLADLRGDGPDLLRVHDGRRVRLSRPGAGLATGWMDAARAERESHDHPRPGASEAMPTRHRPSGASGWCCA